MVWIILIVLIVLLMGFDLVVLNKREQSTNNKKAAKETVFWVCIAASFTAAIYWIYLNGYVDNPNKLSASQAAIKYLTGYLIELSLSVDNLFVIAMIFASFKIPLIYQHKVLFWGIIGAIVFRGIMIGIGVVLINSINWMIYVFGAFLFLTAIKMLFEKDKGGEKEVKHNKLLSYLKLSKSIDGEKFFTVENGVKMLTPLFAALIVIELTDVLFALDSIPAILAVTTDPFIVFSSNIFAILGLRSMYFFLAIMLEKFHYLKYSVIVILIFVSIKLLVMHYVQFPEWISLLVIGVSLATGIFVSIKISAKKDVSEHSDPDQD